MKKSVVFLVFAMFTAMLSGCILSKTPSTNDVTMTSGDQMTFSVNIFPPGGTYAWTLDGSPISYTGKSYLYTALGGNHTLMVKAKQILGTDTQTWNIQVNSPPIAHTGPNQWVAEKALVTLDASNSTDPDNDIVSYAWVQTNGTQVVLSNPSGITTTFLAPEVDESSEALTFKLTVTDSKGLTSIATCIINVTRVNDPPIAEAGINKSVSAGAEVTLNGGDSYDPDDEIASYQWVQTGGPTVTLTNADAAIAQFTAYVVVGSVLTFELTVTDAGGLQAMDTCVITVSNLSAPITDLLNSLVPIPAGTFDMGSTDNEYGYAHYTTPVNAVTLQSFEIGTYEVTQAQYASIMFTNPSQFPGPGYENNPVNGVAWNEARVFCTRLSVLTGRTFTLPSEAQWEYACRAGTTTLYSFGDSDESLGNYAWYGINSNDTTHPVGSKLPNAWGLYDMLGNVWEWCLDSWHDSYTGAPNDGSAWEPDIEGGYRMLRGGGWIPYMSMNFRSAYRLNFLPPNWVTDINIGFRVVAVPAP